MMTACRCRDRTRLKAALLVAGLLAPWAAAAQTVALPPVTAGVLGHMVDSQSDKELGRIIDVLVDETGAPQAAVIDVGGFMGVGTRRVAVAWSALKFAAAKDGVTVSLEIPTDRIKAAPIYEPGKPVDALRPGPPP